LIGVEKREELGGGGNGCGSRQEDARERDAEEMGEKLDELSAA
jgi:hypothetical protein